MIPFRNMYSNSSFQNPGLHLQQVKVLADRKLFISFWRKIGETIIATIGKTNAVHYFHYNPHHHYHFHYHCKMYLYYLNILLTIPLCNIILCLLYQHTFFSEHQTYFRCSLYTYICICSYLHRSSCLQKFFRVGVLKIFSNFTGKHLCWTFLFLKLQTWGLQLYQIETPIQVFSCKICKIFKNIFFYRTPPVAASVYTFLFTLFIYTYVLFIHCINLIKLTKYGEHRK